MEPVAVRGIIPRIMLEVKTERYEIFRNRHDVPVYSLPAAFKLRDIGSE
jgi:hypothetical protein